MPAPCLQLIDRPVWMADASGTRLNYPCSPQGVGYGILVGFGAFFALICSGLAYFDVTFGGHKDSSEHFQTASRNIKTGLIAGAPHHARL